MLCNSLQKALLVYGQFSMSCMRFNPPVYRNGCMHPTLSSPLSHPITTHSQLKSRLHAIQFIRHTFIFLISTLLHVNQTQSLRRLHLLSRQRWGNICFCCINSRDHDWNSSPPPEYSHPKVLQPQRGVKCRGERVGLCRWQLNTELG